MEKFIKKIEYNASLNDRTMNYYPYFLLTILGFVACKPASNSVEDKNVPEPPPNIVVIFTDDQGYQDLGCFGAPDIETPHLDQLAREGARFTQFYASQGVCSASRAALLTGCYSNRVGVSGAYFPYATRGLNPAEVTLAEMLKPQGYATAIFGKWHLGDHPDFLPTKQGFDEYFGIPFSNDMWPLHPANDRFNFDPLPLMEGDSVIQYLEDQSMITTWYTEKAVDFINRKKDQPFFLYVPHSMPHAPLYVSDKFAGKSPRGLYGDVIMEIDWSVGQIVEAIKRNGLEDNTLVIFTSDNGPWLSYGEHAGSALPLREGKGTALEGGVREPCVMWWPNTIPAGTVVNEPAMTIDLMPTLAALCGGELPANPIDGVDIRPLMMGESIHEPMREAFYFYYKANELHAVMSGDGKWKLYLPHTYRSLNGREGGKGGLPEPYEMLDMGQELYNLETDISETTDVSDENPEIVQALLQYAEKARQDLGDKLTDREGTGVRPPGQVAAWKNHNE